MANLRRSRGIFWWLWMLCLIAASSAQAHEESQRLVSATGKAVVKVVPDEIEIILGVETFDPELGKSKEENDKRVARILEKARQFDIEPKHLQTDHLSIDPGSHYYKDKSQQAFRVRRSIIVTLRDLDRFEDLLSACLEVGASHVHGVNFRTTELRKHRDEARRLAVRAAREKAELLAGELEADLGRVFSITEQREYWWSWYSSWWGGNRNSMSQNVVQSGGGESTADGATAPGRIAVSAEVIVKFELR